MAEQSTQKNTAGPRRRRVYTATPSRDAKRSPRKIAAHKAKTSDSRRRKTTAKKPRLGRNNRRTPLSGGNGQKKVVIPPLTDPDTVRIVPLGGVEEVGRNMTIVETKDDLFVVDAGFQFLSEGDAPGIDYILPNTTYVEERKNKLRALIITHGHLDHIGGIQFILDRIGNPPIYTRELTSLMIKKRQEEFPQLSPLKMNVIEPNERLKIGNTYISTFPVTHSIPDSMGVKVETKHGNIVLTGDLKLDHKDGVASDEEEKKWTALGKENNLLFVADSTNAEKSGFSIPEKDVHKNLGEIIEKATGRIVIGTFGSQFERMIHIINTAEKLSKKVVTEGRSIKNNLEIAQHAGILKAKKGTIIPVQEMDNHPAHNLVILATGAQGEEFAALMRIATKKHKFIRFNERDTIVLSSSVIPGNEISVQRLKDNLYRNGVKIMHYRASDVHSTGHGNTGELAWINKKVDAKFFMPAYGYHSMLRCHAQAVVDLNGFPKENIIIPDNGSVIDIKDGTKLNVHKEKAPSTMVMVDGFSIGDMQEVVIRDRQMLSQDGMFVVIGILDLKTGKLRKSPDLISRGFVYLRESQGLLQETRLLIKKTVEDTTKNMHPVNFDMIRENIANTTERFLFQKTNKRPIIIPVIIGV